MEVNTSHNYHNLNKLHPTTINTCQTDLKGKFSKATKADLQYMELVTKL
jgi:hypothetical protein